MGCRLGFPFAPNNSPNLHWRQKAGKMPLLSFWVIKTVKLCNWSPQWHPFGSAMDSFRPKWKMTMTSQQEQQHLRQKRLQIIKSCGNEIRTKSLFYFLYWFHLQFLAGLSLPILKAITKSCSSKHMKGMILTCLVSKAVCNNEELSCKVAVMEAI